MPTLAFCLSLLALLFAPGPTNALLALSGAEMGAGRTLRLLPVVFAAYALTVVPLAALGDDLLRQQHVLRAAVTFAAALWVAWMAIALWRKPRHAAAPHRGSAARLFITTLLNPKAFIIGLVLIPGQAVRGTSLALFFAILAAAAVAWALLGAMLHGHRTAVLPLLRRVCAGWLGLLALALGTAAFST